MDCTGTLNVCNLQSLNDTEEEQAKSKDDISENNHTFNDVDDHNPSTNTFNNHNHNHNNNNNNINNNNVHQDDEFENNEHIQLDNMINNEHKVEEQRDSEEQEMVHKLPPFLEADLNKSYDEAYEDFIQKSLVSTPIFDNTSRDALTNPTSAPGTLYVWAKELTEYSKARKRYLFNAIRIYYDKLEDTFFHLKKIVILSILPLQQQAIHLFKLYFQVIHHHHHHHHNINDDDNHDNGNGNGNDNGNDNGNGNGNGGGDEKLDIEEFLKQYNVFDFQGVLPRKLTTHEFIEACYYLFMAYLRLAKSFHFLKENEQAYECCDYANRLFFLIFNGDHHKRTLTNLVFKKVIKLWEIITIVKSRDSKIIEFIDIFLVEISNLIMKEKGNKLNIDILKEMNYSESRHVSGANTIELLTYFHKFFPDKKVGQRAGELLEELQNLPGLLKKETRLKELIDSHARITIRASGLLRREIGLSPDITWNLLSHHRFIVFPPLPKSPQKYSMESIEVEMNEPYPTSDYSRIVYSFVSAFKSTALLLLVNKHTQKRRLVMEFKGLKAYPVKISLELFVITKLSDLKFFLSVHRIFSYNDNIYVEFEEEEAEGEFIAEFLLKYPNMLTETDVALICKFILFALKALRTRPLDLFLSELTIKNLFVCKNGKLKIIPHCLFEKKYQNYYSTPESLLPQPPKFPIEKTELFNLGCILYQLYESAPPYASFHPLKENFYIATRGLPNLNDRSSDTCRDFYNLIANILPTKRPPIDDLINHNFIKDIDIDETQLSIIPLLNE